MQLLARGNFNGWFYCSHMCSCSTSPLDHTIQHTWRCHIMQRPSIYIFLVGITQILARYFHPKHNSSIPKRNEIAQYMHHQLKACFKARMIKQNWMDISCYLTSGPHRKKMIVFTSFLGELPDTFCFLQHLDRPFAMNYVFPNITVIHKYSPPIIWPQLVMSVRVGNKHFLLLLDDNGKHDNVSIAHLKVAYKAENFEKK